MKPPLRDGSVVLAMVCDQMRDELAQIFGESGWRVRTCCRMDDVRRTLKPGWSGIVVTGESLPGGTWRDIVTLASGLCPRTQTIVASRLADEYLWADVLNHGAFDLIAPPFTAEVARVTASAWERSQLRAHTATA